MKNTKLRGFFAKVAIKKSNKDFINLNEELTTKVKGGGHIVNPNTACPASQWACQVD